MELETDVSVYACVCVVYLSKKLFRYGDGRRREKNSIDMKPIINANRWLFVYCSIYLEEVSMELIELTHHISFKTFVDIP